MSDVVMTGKPPPRNLRAGGAPVLITGCGSGIGLATALALARAGYQVVAGVKSLEEQGTLREDSRKEDLPVDIVPFDITDEASTQEVFHYLSLTYGRLHALVNNAGIAAGGFFEDLDDDEVRSIFETNFFGTARVTRLAIPLLRAAGSSYLIAISSMAGRLGVPAMSVYHATKFALEGLFECIYLELRPHGVRVVLVEPGLIRTSIMGSAFRLCRRFDDPASVNRDRAHKLWDGFQKRFERTAQPPATVAGEIQRILESHDPPLRQPAGLDSKIILFIQKWTPAWLWLRLWRGQAG
ncbi:MAG: SDR family NAD(P)-dependent oxidoreductase [Candidatus Wallbacteria bacterium]|nr:SDR family NAD(P)-dependent oxidoreductase [Candidatus Wallbacteria bacterium]